LCLVYCELPAPVVPFAGPSEPSKWLVSQLCLICFPFLTWWWHI
jgi:hypothetical protein